MHTSNGGIIVIACAELQGINTSITKSYLMRVMLDYQSLPNSEAEFMQLLLSSSSRCDLKGLFQSNNSQIVHDWVSENIDWLLPNIHIVASNDYCKVISILGTEWRACSYHPHFHKINSIDIH